MLIAVKATDNIPLSVPDYFAWILISCSLHDFDHLSFFCGHLIISKLHCCRYDAILETTSRGGICGTQATIHLAGLLMLCHPVQDQQVGDPKP